MNEVIDDRVEEGSNALAVHVRRKNILPKSSQVLKLKQNLAKALFRFCRK